MNHPHPFSYVRRNGQTKLIRVDLATFGSVRYYPQLLANPELYRASSRPYQAIRAQHAHPLAQLHLMIPVDIGSPISGDGS